MRNAKVMVSGALPHLVAQDQLARPGVDHAIQGKTERMMIKNVVLMGALNLIAVTLAATFCLQMMMTLHVTQDMSCVMKAIGMIHTPEGPMLLPSRENVAV